MAEGDRPPRFQPGPVRSARREHIHHGRNGARIGEGPIKANVSGNSTHTALGLLWLGQRPGSGGIVPIRPTPIGISAGGAFRFIAANGFRTEGALLPRRYAAKKQAGGGRSERRPAGRGLGLTRLPDAGVDALERDLGHRFQLDPADAVTG